VFCRGCAPLIKSRPIIEGTCKLRLKLFRNFRKFALTFPISAFPELETGICKQSELELLANRSVLLDQAIYYRVFDSQNLSLKFGFWIHTFARIDPFWDRESILYVQNHLWEFHSFDSGPQKSYWVIFSQFLPITKMLKINKLPP
jgi:hypothetical protein